MIGAILKNHGYVTPAKSLLLASHPSAFVPTGIT